MAFNQTLTGIPDQSPESRMEGEDLVREPLVTVNTATENGN